MQIKNPIQHALKYFPETRDSDRALILKVWELQGIEIAPKFRAAFMDKALSPETIRRTRQKYQELGKYKASDEVNEARYQKFKQTKAEIVTLPDGSQVARLI